jgi:hypothetical protein
VRKLVEMASWLPGKLIISAYCDTPRCPYRYLTREPGDFDGKAWIITCAMCGRRAKYASLHKVAKRKKLGGSGKRAGKVRR